MPSAKTKRPRPCDLRNYAKFRIKGIIASLHEANAYFSAAERQELAIITNTAQRVLRDWSINTPRWKREKGV